MKNSERGEVKMFLREQMWSDKLDYHIADNARHPAVCVLNADGIAIFTLPLSDKNIQFCEILVQRWNSDLTQCSEIAPMMTPKEIAENIVLEMAQWVEKQTEISQENLFELLEEKIVAAIIKDRQTRK